MTTHRPRGRAVPVLLHEPATRAQRQANDDDARWFLANPGKTYRVRPLIAGESPEPMPPGTTVRVMRIGATRVRAFCPPSTEGN